MRFRPVLIYCVSHSYNYCYKHNEQTLTYMLSEQPLT
jgi:hypothetical protein